MAGKIEVKMDERFRLTFPEEVRKELGIEPGDHCWFEVKNGKVFVGRIQIDKKIID